ncbi:hypothetical protein TVAG_079480 [Trichomonas vaginalis G3]|uniref:Uncharacterized protein n=1 Tax=Trichomonas vaginalis (strain ATCC PRA-98 / G3) TaxID=412133 RepID=A2EF80_TRIV3|nr:platelet formation protein family [Trichomonas vaginalis G3]EAY08690.1 hypothetical protein TVAG_079480 [Trichomonas vaginalis G3]KAI5492817.1 platelet formation protein family [Trichomonas vaginalis G3]|eukprot:XP_001320913.1 hypothetical protein [Trichomonas vaginalis G3]
MRLLVGVLSSKKLKLAWGGEDSIKTTMGFFSNCFYFIFFIPSFDPYYYMPNTKAFNTQNKTKTAYQFVFDVLPPWSDDESFKDLSEQERRKARAMKFVNLHMQALESY